MKEVYPFLEIIPEYRQDLMIDLIIYFATLLILSMLIVQFIRRKHRFFELTLFFQMCITDILMVIFGMAFDIAPVFWVLDEENVFFLLMIRFLIAWVIEQIFCVTLLAQWLIYVEYTLHQSRDLIRRRYPAAMIPFIAASSMMIISLPIGFWRSAPFDSELVYALLILLSHAVFMFYIIAAYVVLFLEKKRNRLPAYIRLTPTSLCMIVGFTSNLFLPFIIADYPVLPFFFALGLLFADYYMYRRLKYIDPHTGLFNRKYLPLLITVARKKELKGVTVIRFKVNRGSDVMASLLKSWEPDQCKTISMGDGVFLLAAEPLTDSLAERFISLLTEQVKNRGIPVEADFRTDREGPMHELLMKYS